MLRRMRGFTKLDRIGNYVIGGTMKMADIGQGSSGNEWYM